MKKIFLYSAGILISALVYAAYFFLYEPIYSGSLMQAKQTLIFAHRGYGVHAPDNSLVGAQQAIEQGLDGVDMDAQFSKDKQVFIFHDVSLERFTTGEGRVDAYTLDELRAYDLGDKFGDGTLFHDVRIESFETFVQEVTPYAHLMVELKVASLADTGIEKAVLDVLLKYDVFERVYISSFNPAVIRRLEALDTRIQTVLIFQDSGWDPKRVLETKEEDRVSLPWYLRTEWTRRGIRKFVRPDALSVHELVDENVIDTLIKKGWPVFLWPLNDERSLAWGVKKSVYGIVTDQPQLAKEYITKSAD
jgi:glycerophosphoryl diester phosphodiesterase